MKDDYVLLDKMGEMLCRLSEERKELITKGVTENADTIRALYTCIMEYEAIGYLAKECPWP